MCQCRAPFLQAPELADHITEVAWRLRRLLADSADRRERAAAVLALGGWHEELPSGSRRRRCPGLSRQARAVRVPIAGVAPLFGDDVMAGCDAWLREDGVG